uniref:UP1 n=1 Tax=Mycobacterium paratuberculosis TaxID=1770 RepID=F2XXF0_MYCPC|nr:UP1 [Mycobacterium avium subsp. paratuberculosis]
MSWTWVVEGPAVDEDATGAGARIVELDALGKQLQRGAEVIGRHVNDVGIQRITDDRYAQRGHLQAQLMGASGAWPQPVQTVRGQQLHLRQRVGRPGFADRLHPAPVLDDAAGQHPREHQRRVDGGPGQIGLVHQPAGEQRLIGAAHLAPRGEQQHPGGQPVQPVRGAQLGQAELPAQPHQRGLGDVPSARHGGQKVRLVDDDDVVVAVQHREVEGHHHLVGQLAIEVHTGPGRQHGGLVDHRPVGGNHFGGKDFGAGRGAEPGGELGQHRTAAQPHPGGSQPVANRQRRRSQLSGTGSRISARASGALARSSSADTSSGWACDRISACTRAV